MKSLIVILVLALAPAPVLWAADAPYHAAWERIAVPDVTATKELAVMMWYPTLAPEQDLSIGPFRLRVAPGAAVADGRFGLILISHGRDGGPLPLRDTAEALARAGFLVAALQHPRDSLEDGSSGNSDEAWIGRPRQLRRTVDWLAQDTKFSPHLDAKRIGALGHSLGGYSVLALVTGRADMALNRTHCLAHPDDVNYCGPPQSGPPGPARQLPVLQVEPDTRIKALVLLAPATIPFSPEVLGKVHIPVRLYAAERDELVTPRYHADPFRAALGSPPEFVLVRNAGHFAFVAPFPESMRAAAGMAAIDPPGFDRAAFRRQLNPEIVDFFRRSLR